MPLMNMGHYSAEDISMIQDNRVGCIHSGTKNNSPIIVLGQRLPAVCDYSRNARDQTESSSIRD